MEEDSKPVVFVVIGAAVLVVTLIVGGIAELIS